MARVTVEDCLKKVENRFSLVMLATKRVRQIKHGDHPRVNSRDNREIVISLREIAEGKVKGVVPGK